MVLASRVDWGIIMELVQVMPLLPHQLKDHQAIYIQFKYKFSDN
jgi:hypothetical protein